jgi:serine/threonine-protein kinase
MDPQQGPPQPDLIIGQTIGNYLVTQKLGEGGMGAVYLAEHPSIGKKVALKVLHAEFSSNEDVVTRFFNEAKAVNNIGHPNIVDITDYGVIQIGIGRDQLVYFIMEYLGGMTLSKLIANEAPLPPERALSIGLQVADALAASHKCGIVHRDLKPDNIMLLHRGRERDFVKLLDFGIAKLTDNTGQSSHKTRTGIVMGTPAYMSPEQCDGRGNIDHRTDIYALGIVLYEMLVGRVPFLGEGYGEVLVQHLTQAPVPPSQFRMINPHVEAVMMKALEKRVELRYPTMDEMIRAMTDPVSFVESHGGVGTFTQVQLMPSTAPMPEIRLTPSPLSHPSMPTYPTPAPGMMTPHSMQGHHPPTNPPTPGAHAAPTTLGAATGITSGEPKKSKLAC